MNNHDSHCRYGTDGEQVTTTLYRWRSSTRLRLGQPKGLIARQRVRTQGGMNGLTLRGQQTPLQS
jgi:hypothetical protein